jgi:hypothetical protein
MGGVEGGRRKDWGVGGLRDHGKWKEFALVTWYLCNMGKARRWYALAWGIVARFGVRCLPLSCYELLQNSVSHN